MFKPELWKSHDEYRTIVTGIGRRLSRNNPKYSFDSYEEEFQKPLNLSLSFWTMLIGICIHLDAKYKAAHMYAA